METNEATTWRWTEPSVNSAVYRSCKGKRPAARFRWKTRFALFVGLLDGNCRITRAPNERREDLLLKFASDCFRESSLKKKSLWMGFRPSNAGQRAGPGRSAWQSRTLHCPAVMGHMGMTAGAIFRPLHVPSWS